MAIPHWPTLIVLLLISLLLLAVSDRRVAMVSLLAQYTWLSSQMGAELYRPVALMRLGLGLVLCLILYLTARHVELTEIPSKHSAMNGGFRLAVVALGAWLAYSMWHRYPLATVPDILGLTCYWLAFDGLLLILISTEPFHMGLGLITLINGFEGVYLFQERGLLVIGLVGIIDICIALGTVYFAEVGLDSATEAGSSDDLMARDASEPTGEEAAT